MAWPPAVTWIVPVLTKSTEELVLTRKASLETLLMSPALLIVRFAIPELLSIARPVPSVWIVPLLMSVEVPVMLTATLPPLAMRISPPASTVPVPPESVCVPVTVSVTGFGPGANCANAGAATVSERNGDGTDGKAHGNLASEARETFRRSGVWCVAVA